jgi:hypothetical protein
MKDENLTGIYKISFNIEIESQDELALSDLSFLLTEGVGEALAAKVSYLAVEKVEKTGHIEPKVFKIGDKVQLRDSLTIKANIYSDDGYHFIGQPSDISEIVTEEPISLDIEAGSIGYVNSILNGKIEITDLDRPITSYQAIGIEAVNVDLITVDAEQLEKLDSNEVK